MEEIHNPDILKIRELAYLRESVESLERRREWIRERSRKITRQFSPLPPGGGGSGRAIDDTVAELDEMDGRYTMLIRSYLRQLRKAEKLLLGIESVQMRTFVTMAYLENRKGPDIQKRLNMSRWVYENNKRNIEQADSLADVPWHDR